LYYREARGAVVVFDVTDPRSLRVVEKWKNDIDSKVPGIPIILLANKVMIIRYHCHRLLKFFFYLQVDLLEGNVQRSHIEKISQENEFAAWFPTSAKNNFNLDESMGFLVEEMLKQDHLYVTDDQNATKDENIVKLTADGPPTTETTPKKCSC
jgi:Ras-related protein Rab-32